MSNRKLTTINMEMVRDWYTISDAMVYSRIRWLEYNTNQADIKYPSIKQISEDLCLSRITVINSLKKLENWWIIEVYRGWYKERNSYYIDDMDKYPCKMEKFNGKKNWPYATC